MEGFGPDEFVRILQGNDGEDDNKGEEEGDSDPTDPCESLNGSSKRAERSVAVRETDKLVRHGGRSA